VTSATKKRKPIELPITQFIAIIVLSISIFLIIDFGRRAATGYRVRREEEKLQAQLEAAQETQRALLDKRSHVESDAYVEEIVRNELKWSKPGETVIVVMPTPQVAVHAELSADGSAAGQTTVTPLQAWFDLFFATP